ncbi:hypothetical protein KIKIMORA_02820 [Brevundimonas phage vB_BpoS-Kikimora]|uniref:Uncharacterized protein n=1 Tax=Brevundimonas phage vB_BpoS-Kikimora TaxID=2948601 RepID=A0A9E7SKE2_9CAUD|nr:hypothetical protein KIKIMORA_02820 [Brevundimonas phage vB_BpoS-Kikimora]
MTVTTYTFRAYKGSASYTCTCRECGKVVKRTVSTEMTVNPFNKNEDGTVRTPAEVQHRAYAEAKEQAQKLEGTDTTCRECVETPRRELLLTMAAEPDRVFPKPEKYWNSPMHYLADRKQVSEVHERCECQSDCCSGWKKSPGFRITKAGLERAAKFRAKVAA